MRVSGEESISPLLIVSAKLSNALSDDGHATVTGQMQPVVMRASSDARYSAA